MTTDRFKLYSADEGKSWELYDLLEDPSEAQDLASDLADKVQQMSSALLEWRESCRLSDQGGDY